MNPRKSSVMPARRALGCLLTLLAATPTLAQTYFRNQPGITLLTQNKSAGTNKFGFYEYAPNQSFPPKRYLKQSTNYTSAITEAGVWTWSTGSPFTWGASIVWTNGFSSSIAKAGLWEYNRQTREGPAYTAGSGSRADVNARTGEVSSQGDPQQAYYNIGPFDETATYAYSPHPTVPNEWVLDTATFTPDDPPFWAPATPWGPMMVSGFGQNPSFQVRQITSTATEQETEYGIATYND